MCMEESEPMDHFVSCEENEEAISIDWENILSKLLEEEIIFGKYIEKDTKEDQILSTNRRLARPLNQTPLLQGYCRALWNK